MSSHSFSWCYCHEPHQWAECTRFWLYKWKQPPLTSPRHVILRSGSWYECRGLQGISLRTLSATKHGNPSPGSGVLLLSNYLIVTSTQNGLITFQNAFRNQEFMLSTALWNRHGCGSVLYFIDGSMSHELGDWLVPWQAINITASSTIQALSCFLFMKPSHLPPGILSFLKDISDCHLILC